MSLDSHLARGDLGRWCQTRLTGAAPLVDKIVATAADAAPVRPIGRVDAHHWSAIGTAFGQRLGFLVQHAPPYYALLGAINAEIMHPNAAHAAAGQFPTHADLPRLRVRQFALDQRPTPGGWWHINGVFDSPAGNIWYRVDRDTETVAADFMARLVDYLTAHAPAGQVAGPGVEAGLARCCWVLAGWENSYRGGHLTPADDDLYHGINPLTVEAMRASAPEAAVTELGALARKLTEHHGLAQLRDLADDPPTGQPLGIAGPVLVPSWADADLLVGDCLVEVKTVINTRDRERITRWLWQLLAYAWLDEDDRYTIRHVGLYLARHGQLLTWPLADYAATLTAGADLEQLRREFHDLAASAITADRGTRPPAGAGRATTVRGKPPWDPNTWP